MTRKFNIHYTCQTCGAMATAETGFGRWMRNNPRLDSASGIVRTDLDHVILRYMTTFQKRDFQLMMIVEVKEYGKEPDAAQVDILSFLRQLAEFKGTNMHNFPTVQCVKARSKMTGRDVRLRFFGVHLLQFEKTNPMDSLWIKWDRKIITPAQLEDILAMNVRPDDTSKPMIDYLRDRHRAPREQLLNL
jgi:hypothetical protein